MFSRVFTWKHVFYLLSRFWMSLTQVILCQNWYSFNGTCYHVKNSCFHGKHVSTHHICSHNLVDSRELSQLNSWIHLQNIWNHGSLFAGNASFSASRNSYTDNTRRFLLDRLLRLHCIVWFSPPVDDGDTPPLEAVVQRASNSIFNAVERAVSNIHELVPGDAIVDEDSCTYHDGVAEATSGIYLAVERGVGKLHGLVASLRGEPAHLATSKLHQVRAHRHK